jgi:septal ring factor EnvC (AmiA/AmiB activator)
MTKTIEDLKAEIASLDKKVVLLETELDRKSEMIKTQENWIAQLQNKL